MAGVIEAAVRERLRAAGMRVTEQRLVIASALERLGGHRTARDILEELRRTGADAGVSVPTVYRAMAVFLELRLVGETTEAASGETAYEWLEHPHHHIRCASCGAEVEVAGLHVERLASALHKETGFEVTVNHLAFEGRCATCAS